ncbi:uncharacterized protein BDR25DRAFT_350309 [Lindgomyces ingoldianus]|uniref:Uncharacterized protein n=1 Tax=Lindgomyces ingoldianus TaxID=673940 RepID=A0ACB6RAC6_9PLEO|nr:uncharacterized protein BDR25DRAFT_350309 [Lindgomyces ingoldianus]KAF2476042.1 hypothetical protein BDR25DRAFT_350309 [Lindgomyces ingoldianus]
MEKANPPANASPQTIILKACVHAIRHIFVPSGTSTISNFRKNGRALRWLRETIGVAGGAVTFDFVDANFFEDSQHKCFQRELEGSRAKVASWWAGGHLNANRGFQNEMQVYHAD